MSHPEPRPQPRPRLVRPDDDRVIAGVCAGVARYLRMDPTLVRILTVLLVVVGFFTPVIVYLAAWVLMPEE